MLENKNFINLHFSSMTNTGIGLKFLARYGIFEILQYWPDIDTDNQTIPDCDYSNIAT